MKSFTGSSQILLSRIYPGAIARTILVSDSPECREILGEAGELGSCAVAPKAILHPQLVRLISQLLGITRVSAC